MIIYPVPECIIAIVTLGIEVIHPTNMHTNWSFASAVRAFIMEMVKWKTLKLPPPWLREKIKNNVTIG